MLTTWFPDAWSRPTTRDVTWERLAARLVRHPQPPDLPWACSVKCSRKRWMQPGPCPNKGKDGRRCGAELVPDKRGLPAWSPWCYMGERRAKEGATAACAVVLDYDGGVTADDVARTWDAWEHVGHTTWSHSDPASARLRLVLPLAEPVSAATWPRLWLWLCAQDARLDTQCSDAGRLFYLPFRSATGEPMAWHHASRPLLEVDVLELPALPSCRKDAPRHPAPTGDRRRYRTPAERRALGEQLGGRLRGEGDDERVVGVTCPRCHEDEVWWFVAPRSWAGCGCNHRESCQWTGWLDQLGGGAP